MVFMLQNIVQSGEQMLTLQDPTLFRETCLVGQEWSDHGATSRIEVTNPATGAVIGSVPSLGRAVAARAIEIAVGAQAEWACASATARADVLKRWLALVRDAREDLARILTCEQGKPLAEARGEIDYSASYIEWFAEEARRLYGESIPAPVARDRLYVTRVPVGVTAAITPWNFPAAMIARKVAPALAAGCAMIVKPSELTPFSAFALAVLAERAGLPAGLLQVITGEPREIGDVLCASPEVRKLSFTGSTATGRILMANCAPTVKRLSLELGGNAPFIVFDDANLEAAVEGAIHSKFRNAGQTCVCTNRLLVQAGVYETFVEKLSEAVSRLQPGDGAVPGTDIGPLINAAAVEKIEAHIADAVRAGASVRQGGARAGGLFFQPTVLRDVTPAMRVAREETFGPLAPVFRFETEAEAIAMANDTEFGLAAYFYTENHARFVRVSEALEYGMVGHNTGLISTAVAPFGGVKQSGFGREGSRHGIEDYTSLKYVCSKVG